MATTRDKAIMLRVTEPERDALHAAAERSHLRLGEWARMTLMAAARTAETRRGAMATMACESAQYQGEQCVSGDVASETVVVEGKTYHVCHDCHTASLDHDEMIASHGRGAAASALDAGLTREVSGWDSGPTDKDVEWLARELTRQPTRDELEVFARAYKDEIADKAPRR